MIFIITTALPLGSAMAAAVAAAAVIASKAANQHAEGDIMQTEVLMPPVETTIKNGTNDFAWGELLRALRIKSRARITDPLVRGVALAGELGRQVISSLGITWQTRVVYLSADRMWIGKVSSALSVAILLTALHVQNSTETYHLCAGSAVLERRPGCHPTARSKARHHPKGPEG